MSFSNYNNKSKKYYFKKLLENAMKREQQVICNMKIIVYFIYIFKRCKHKISLSKDAINLITSKFLF